MACSIEVIGPDSLASTLTVPVRAAMTSAGSHRVRAKTEPAAAINSSRPAYSRRRPIRSPTVPTATDIRANPASIAVNTAPTLASL